MHVKFNALRDETQHPTNRLEALLGSTWNLYMGSFLMVQWEVLALLEGHPTDNLTCGL